MQKNARIHGQLLAEKKITLHFLTSLPPRVMKLMKKRRFSGGTTKSRRHTITRPLATLFHDFFFFFFFNETNTVAISNVRANVRRRRNKDDEKAFAQGRTRGEESEARIPAIGHGRCTKIKLHNSPLAMRATMSRVARATVYDRYRVECEFVVRNVFQAPSAVAVVAVRDEKVSKMASYE